LGRAPTLVSVAEQVENIDDLLNPIEVVGRKPGG